MGVVMTGLVTMVWSVSADREHRDKMPDVCDTSPSIQTASPETSLLLLSITEMLHWFEMGMLTLCAGQQVVPVTILEQRDHSA